MELTIANNEQLDAWLNYQLTALAGLSLQHASKYAVQAPTNEDRLRAFRACVRPEIGNSHVWPWTRRTGDKK